MNKMQRTYYPDGSIRTEVTYVDGLPDGVARHWHPNGILASELPVRRGIPEGIGKQWNEKGELLGAFEIKDGTGVQLQWYPDGTLMSEMPWLHGNVTGRFRAYYEDGELAGDIYWLDDKKVSRKRYMEACKRNPELPRYEPERSARKPRSKEKAPEQPAREMTSSDEIELQLLAGPAVREALAWLQETRQPSRSLGEATGQDESIRLVKKLYALGAVTVHAVEIDGAPSEDQNTGKVVIELPQEQGQRDKLMKYCGKLAHEQGFDPEPDVGQRYLFLMLD